MWICRSGAGRPSRLAKNAPASPMLEASGPVPRSFQRAKLRTLLSWARSVTPWVYQSIGTTGWSCRLAPTPGRSTRDSTPTSARWLAGPMPERSSSCGLLIEPPHSSTSRRAVTVWSRPAWRNVTPVARFALVSSTRAASAPVVTVRLGRVRAGLR